MGVVYAARHLRLDRPVAIKLMHASFAASETAVRRFFDEARAAGGLRHPNVIDVVDVDTDEAQGGAPFMVMELLEGESLAALLARRGVLPADEALALIDPVLSALEAAHARGIVHRDLKPDNIFLAREHGTIVPKLLDFGIAKLRDAQGPGTATGSIVGTPMYMSPEQAAGTSEVGPFIDVWAMGAVLFEALSGRPHLELPSEPNVMGILAALATQTPRRLADVAPHVPETIASAVDAALAREPSARVPSIASLRARLRGDAFAPTLAATPAPLPSTRELVPTRVTPSLPPRPRRAHLMVLALVVVGAGTLAVGAWTWRARSVMRAEAVEAAAATVTGTETVTVTRAENLTGPEDQRETEAMTAAETETNATSETMTVAEAETNATSETAPSPGRRPRAIESRATEPRATEPHASAATRTGTWNPDDL